MPLSTKAGRVSLKLETTGLVESRCVEAITSRSKGTVGIFGPRDAHSGGENQACFESHARVRSYHPPRRCLPREGPPELGVSTDLGLHVETRLEVDDAES